MSALSELREASAAYEEDEQRLKALGHSKLAGELFLVRCELERVLDGYCFGCDREIDDCRAEPCADRRENSIDDRADRELLLLREAQ